MNLDLNLHIIRLFSAQKIKDCISGQRERDRYLLEVYERNIQM